MLTTLQMVPCIKYADTLILYIGIMTKSILYNAMRIFALQRTIYINVTKIVHVKEGDADILITILKMSFRFIA